MTPRVLIVGATGGIARALAQCFAQGGFELILAGRDLQELERVASDVRVRHGVGVSIAEFHAQVFQMHGAFFDDCVASGPLDGVVLCHGTLKDQLSATSDFAGTRREIDVNFSSYVSLLDLAAEYFSAQGTGFICALSSVAGDRGRQSNYTYGATKAALSTYLAGLRNRLHSRGVLVVTVKPGFVDTSMTWGLLDSEGRLVAQPDRVAKDIYRAVVKRRDVVYTPWFWRWIMLVIRAIPERLFKRLKL